MSDATDVVALLTQRSIDRPWILYEAGVAKGKLNATFTVWLSGCREKVSTGPFGQFENSADDEDSLTKLVLQLLQRNPDASPREEAVLGVKLSVGWFPAGLRLRRCHGANVNFSITLATRHVCWLHCQELFAERRRMRDNAKPR